MALLMKFFCQKHYLSDYLSTCLNNEIIFMIYWFIWISNYEQNNLLLKTSTSSWLIKSIKPISNFLSNKYFVNFYSFYKNSYKFNQFLSIVDEIDFFCLNKANFKILEKKYLLYK